MLGDALFLQCFRKGDYVLKTFNLVLGGYVLEELWGSPKSRTFARFGLPLIFGLSWLASKEPGQVVVSGFAILPSFDWGSKIEFWSCQRGWLREVWTRAETTTKQVWTIIDRNVFPAKIVFWRTFYSEFSVALHMTFTNICLNLVGFAVSFLLSFFVFGFSPFGGSCFGLFGVRWGARRPPSHRTLPLSGFVVFVYVGEFWIELVLHLHTLFSMEL